MENTQPEGHFSPRQFATICDLGEGSVRLALKEGRLTASKCEDGRRWIPEAEITARFALQLTSPIIQAATLARLRLNAAAARAELSPDTDLIASAEAYLRALNTEPSTASSVEHEPTRNEPTHRPVLVATGD